MTLRIIGGDFKGKKLHPIRTIRGAGIRPTADRIRESIFNIINFQVHGSVVLDLFAGTGALGLEALSRGAEFAVFVDYYKKVLFDIERNIHALALDNKTKIIKWDITKNLNCIHTIETTAGSDRLIFDLVFMDPPYNRKMIKGSLLNLYLSGSLAEEVVIIVEHTISEPLSENLSEFKIYDQRNYGKTTISFLSRN
jgi:16S rRNA (guanine966-N2)-methyltransferase